MKNKSKQKASELIFDVPNWMNYINHFKEPCNDVKRLRYHYLCLKKYVGFRQFFLNVVFAIIAYLPLLIILSIKSIFIKKTKADAVLFCTSDSMQGILEKDFPQELKTEYPNMVAVKKSLSKFGRMFDGIIDAGALRSIIKVFLRYPFAAYMNFYYLLHVAFICKIKRQYSPKAIVSIQTEFDFATSMLSDYCESQNVEYIGFAHGEYVLTPERAFVRYSRYYAWDEDMIELFYITRSPKQNFFVYKTNRLKPIFTKQKNPSFYLTYYLDEQKYDDIVKLKNILISFEKKGYKVKLRIHPRESNLSLTKEIFKNTTIVVEDPQTVSLKTSIENSRYIVSTRSTVLREAFVSGFDVVIDDMSGFIPINVLEELRYDMLKKTTLRLSQLMEGN